MFGHELVMPFISIIILMILISILLFQFNQRIGRSRSVRVISANETCAPALGELPVIPVKQCQNSDGTQVQCYQPDPGIDLIFEISTNSSYYKSVCTRLCQQISTNGGCVQQTDTYDKCISLLEPPEGCNSSANPLGRLTGTNDVYYASGIVN